MSANNEPPIAAHARNEIQAITREFDWNSHRAKPLPREAIEELMVLAFVRGASYSQERHDPLTRAAVTVIDGHLKFIRAEVEYLSSREAPWATRKVEALQEIAQTLRRTRQDLQMRGMDGRRLDQ